MRTVKVKGDDVAIRDTILSSAKRERQRIDHEAVRSGRKTAQSMHLFGSDLAKKVTVRYKDVDFD